jgi:hypothetical protein
MWKKNEEKENLKVTIRSTGVIIIIIIIIIIIMM